MNTLWHVFWAYVVFRGRSWCWKAVVASALPDVAALVVLFVTVLYGGFRWEWFVDAYGHSWALGFSVVTHSVVVVGVVALVLVLLKMRVLLPWVWGWLAHVVLDVPTHASDAYPYLWPLVGWVFRSPWSYWEPAFHSFGVNVVNLVLAMVAVLWMARRPVRGRFEAFFLLFVTVGLAATVVLFVNSSPASVAGMVLPLHVVALVVFVMVLVVRYRRVLVGKPVGW